MSKNRMFIIAGAVLCLLGISVGCGAELDAEPDTATGTEPDAETGAEPDAETDAEPSTDTSAEPDAETRAETPDSEVGTESPVPSTNEPDSADSSPEQNLSGIITGAQAKDIIESNDAAILLDVRNPDEYAERHIEGSLNIPVSELGERLSELPDKDAVIIVFCRAGRRSAKAYDILINNGYTNVLDMQTIDNWPG